MNINKNTRLYSRAIVLAQLALLALLPGQALFAAPDAAGSKPNIKT